MKTEVYSWRLTAARKAELESEARRDGKSIARLLEEITADWLRRRRNGRDLDEAEQAAIRKRVLAAIGSIRSGDPTLASRSREIVRERIARKHEEESRAFRRTH